MRVLMEEYEPLLYERGAVVSTRAPAHYVAAFNAQGDRERKLAQFGYAALQATSLLVQRAQNADPDDDEEFTEERVGGRDGEPSEKPQPRRSRGWRVASYPRVSLRHTALGRQCPMPSAPQPCPEGRATGGGAGAKYRAIDGRCNSPEHPERGAAGTPLRRLLPPHYKDGLERPREAASGGPLPSARAVSVAVHGQRDIDLAAVTHLLMQWGQLIDHDLTASAQSRGFNSSVPKCCTDDGSSKMPSELLHPDCMSIPVARDDWFLGPLGVRCLDFVRSGAAPRPGCALGPRDQLNRVTAFLDGSAVYGSTAADARRLRLRRGGLLRYRRVSGRLPLLPAAARGAAVQLCAAGSAAGGECFDAGDGRVNEQPGLIAAHALLLRAHNRFATRLAHLNAHWSDERLFQEARRLIAAVLQHITYREFLPLVLGPDVVKSFGLELTRRGYYKGYDPEVNPAISNAFATAAFRFGHSLVQNSLLRCDRSHRPVVGSNVSLHEELTKPNYIHHAGSIDKLLLGMCAQPAQKRDEFITDQLTNHLFQTGKFLWGMDLAALNIQRGRDHGLAPYNSWREACGLQPFTSWVQMLKVMSPETQRKLKSIYRDIDDIDLFPGAMAEKPVSGGLVGPTFACIIAQQFSNLRKGDRFWYENGGYESSFTPAQLQQIRKMNFARILCDNLDSIDTIQPFVFLTSDNDRNMHKPCEKISSFDLTPWTEHRVVNEYNHHEDDHNYDHDGHHEDHHHHHHYEIPTPPPPPHHEHDQHDSYHPTNEHNQHDSYHPTNEHDHHDSYHPTNDHFHPDSYNKPTTSFPIDDYSEPSYHVPSYEKPHTSLHDHYKPPNNDYETPVLYNERPTPSSHYHHSASKPTYILKPQNNYSITYIYEFDYEQKPQPTPTVTYNKPRPTIKPTSTYTVIHLHQSVEQVTHHSPSSYSDSDSYDHSKPHHSKPHDDSYLPDHSHHHSGSYSPPKYPTERPSYGHRPHPSFDDNYKPPSIDNYGPALTYPSDQSQDSYKPLTDSYHPHKPHDHNPNNYKPHNTIQTYKPLPNDYGHSSPSHNYGPSTQTYGHPPNKFGQTNINPYGSSKPIPNKYPSTSAHHYGISINQQINNKVTTFHTSHDTKPLSEFPMPVNYPKPEIIYSDSKPSAHENNLHFNHPKPILLTGSSTDYTVLEIPPERSHSCKGKPCSESMSIVHHFPPTSHSVKGDHGKYGSSREHPQTSFSSNSEPLHLTEFYNKPILLYTYPSTKQTIPPRMKGARPNLQATKEAEESRSELPSPALDASTYLGTSFKKNSSEKWSFDVKELEDEEEFSDVPFLPNDPDSSRELPQPILEPEELDEDEDIFSSRSL